MGGIAATAAAAIPPLSRLTKLGAPAVDDISPIDHLRHIRRAGSGSYSGDFAAVAKKPLWMVEADFGADAAEL